MSCGFIPLVAGWGGGKIYRLGQLGIETEFFMLIPLVSNYMNMKL